MIAKDSNPLQIQVLKRENTSQKYFMNLIRVIHYTNSHHIYIKSHLEVQCNEQHCNIAISTIYVFMHTIITWTIFNLPIRAATVSPFNTVFQSSYRKIYNEYCIAVSPPPKQIKTITTNPQNSHTFFGKAETDHTKPEKKGSNYPDTNFI